MTWRSVSQQPATSMILSGGTRGGALEAGL